MAILKIYTIPHSILRKKAREINSITSEIEKLAHDMIDTMFAANGVGLAAPQVGQSLRLIVLDKGYLTYDEKLERGEQVPENPPREPEILINPTIVSKEGNYEMEEGCLSVPGFRANVKRYGKVTIRYLDMRGQEKKWTGEFFTAAAFQHEIDHLNGILFIDYLSLIKKRMAQNKVKKFLKSIKGNQGNDIENLLYG